jgi:hypothetical protein
MNSGIHSSGVPSVQIELADDRRIQDLIEERYRSVVERFDENFLEHGDFRSGYFIWSRSTVRRSLGRAGRSEDAATVGGCNDNCHLRLLHAYPRGLCVCR